jgi:hypothetical protein
MKKHIFVMILFLVLSTAALGNVHLTSFAFADSEEGIPILAMPVEYVNYTIVSVDGSLWAKIDGYYPIYMISGASSVPAGSLQMVYPMPPQTTNISVVFNGQEVSWENYTAVHPEAMHHTAIGDWWMISSVLEGVSDFFVMQIHYMHPLQVINGSCLFLYDLNISPYLSPQNSSSTVYFTVRFEENVTNVRAYTAKTDSQWNPIEFTTSREGAVTTVSIPERSAYDDLPGDLVVEFDRPNMEIPFFVTPPTPNPINAAPQFPLWVIPVLAGVVLVGVLFYVKSRTRRPLA